MGKIIMKINAHKQFGGISKLMLVVVLGLIGSGVYYAKDKGFVTKESVSNLSTKISSKFSGSGGYSGYGVQVMATGELKQAKSVMDDFARDGYSAFVLASKNKGRTLYKVRLGPYEYKPEANAIKDKVKQRYPRSPYIKTSFVIYRPN